MSEHDRVAALILERLAGPGAPFRTELAELLADQLLGQRVRDALDFEQIRDVIEQSLSTANVRRVVAEHVAPGFARYAQAIVGQSVCVGSLVDSAAHQKLHAVARELRLPAARWSRSAVDPALVRQLLRPVWTQVLLNFAKRLPVPLAGSPGAAATSRSPSFGISGFLARSVQEQAEKLIDRGRSAMGGLGAEVERRLSAAARDFSDTAAQAFRQSLLERLQSDEGRALFGQILAGFTDHVLRTRFADLQHDLDALPLAEVLDLVPDLVGHAAQSAFVQEIVQRELEIWLAAHGERAFGDLLSDYALRAPVRGLLVQHIDRLAAGVVTAPQFADWVGRLVRPDRNE